MPVHAAGIQAHLTYRGFARQFNENAYRAFLAELAARGLTIMITEMDVLDEPAVKVFVTFGLSDRYTWLQEDGAPLW